MNISGRPKGMTAEKGRVRDALMYAALQERQDISDRELADLLTSAGFRATTQSVHSWRKRRGIARAAERINNAER